MACPICNKATVVRFRPFCSGRCADVDLAHWLRGDYRIPVGDEDISAENEQDALSGNFRVDSSDQGG